MVYLEEGENVEEFVSGVSDPQKIAGEEIFLHRFHAKKQTEKVKHRNIERDAEKHSLLSPGKLPSMRLRSIAKFNAKSGKVAAAIDFLAEDEDIEKGVSGISDPQKIAKEEILLNQFQAQKPVKSRNIERDESKREEISMVMDDDMESLGAPSIITGYTSYNVIVGSQPDCTVVGPGASRRSCIDDKIDNLHPIEYDQISIQEEVINADAKQTSINNTEEGAKTHRPSKRNLRRGRFDDKMDNDQIPLHEEVITTDSKENSISNTEQTLISNTEEEVKRYVFSKRVVCPLVAMVSVITIGLVLAIGIKCFFCFLARLRFLTLK